MHIARTIRSAAITALVVAGLAACSSSAADTTAETSARAHPGTSTTLNAPARPTKPIDEVVAVGERDARMHIACTGEGPATVLLVAGFGGASDSWTAVAPTVARQARVCSYDRFGTGTSDAPPSVQTFRSQAEDLRELLRAAGEPGPFVVAGHSFGGAEAVAFASRYADEVEGLLLVDASPTDWPRAACAVPDDGSEMGTVFRDTCHMISDPVNNPERLDAERAFAEVAQVDSLSDLPLVVATRADVVYPGMDPKAEAALATAWHRGQEHWASLSTDATIIPVEDTSHSIQFDQPSVVIDALTDLLARSGRAHLGG